LRREDVARRLADFLSALVQKHLVFGVAGGFKTEYFTAYPVVNAHRVSYVFAVGFKPDVKGFPSSGEFSFPGEFTFSFGNVCFTFVSASLDEFAADF
jgi:hypothetical protein